MKRKTSKKRGRERRLGGKRRGKGNKGGRGRAGSGKKGAQKKTYFMRKGGGIGKEKLKSKVAKKIAKEIKLINIGEIDDKIQDLLSKKLAKKVGDSYEINIGELGYDKVGGKGKIRNKLIVHAKIFSKKAIEKIEKTGGKAIIES